MPLATVKRKQPFWQVEEKATAHSMDCLDRPSEVQKHVG